MIIVWFVVIFQFPATLSLVFEASQTSTSWRFCRDSCLQLSQHRLSVWHSHKDRLTHWWECNQQCSFAPEDQLNVSFTHPYTHTHLHADKHTQPGRGSWRRRRLRYRDPCPLISASDNYVWRSFVPCFGETLHKSLWNWHDGYSGRQLLPSGLSPHPSSLCCL